MTLDYTALIMTDGRDDLLTLAMSTLDTHLSPAPARIVIHDDTGDPDHRRQLRLAYLGAEVIGDGPRRGFAGAIQYAWKTVDATPRGRGTSEPFVFHTEDDMALTGPVDVRMMAHALIENPDLAQLALLRGPVNVSEAAAGGVIEQRPDEYDTERCLAGCCTWRSHTLYWTTNPSLFRADILSIGWPDAPDSEARMAPHVTKYLGALRPGESPPPLHPGGMPTVFSPRFAYWSDRVLVQHLGAQRHREGTGY